MTVSLSISGIVQDLGWLICGLYCTIPTFWLAVHPFVDRWRQSRYKFKLLAPWWMLLWLVAWAVSFPWRHATFYQPHWIVLVAFAFWSVSITMYFKGGSGLSTDRIIGKNEVEPNHPDQRLVTTGIYARTRNPIYLGHLCTMLGWSIATGTRACWTMTAFYFVTLLIMLPMEEKELRHRFGAEYDAYCKRTPRLLPRLF